MVKIIISILAAVAVVINTLVVYTCCVAAGDADDAAEQIWRGRDESGTD